MGIVSTCRKKIRIFPVFYEDRTSGERIAPESLTRSESVFVHINMSIESVT